MDMQTNRIGERQGVAYNNVPYHCCHTSLEYLYLVVVSFCWFSPSCYYPPFCGFEIQVNCSFLSRQDWKGLRLDYSVQY